MTLTLLPGHGAELPWAGRSLRFGMTLDEVRGSVEPYAALHDTFVCRSAWAQEFTVGSLRVCVFAGETDALSGVSVGRTRHREARHVPVGLDDIDLFGWPADEIVEALRDTGRRVRATRTSAWVDGALHLDWTRPCAPGARPFVGHLCLYRSSDP